MRRNAWIGLGLVTVVAVAAAAYTVKVRDSAVIATGLEDASGERLFTDLDERINDVRAIAFRTASESWRVTRHDDGTWSMPEKSNYPASADKVKKTILAFSDLSVVEPKTANPELYERIGVRDIEDKDSKAVLVRLLNADDQAVAELLVGDTKVAESEGKPAQVYVRKPGDARSWLVRARLDVADEPKGWLDGALPGVKREEVASVDIRHPDGEIVQVSRNAENDTTFDLAGVPEDHKIKSNWDVASIAGALESVAFEDVSPAAKKDFSEGVEALYRTDEGALISVRSLAEDRGEGQDNWFWFTLHATVADDAADKDKAAARAEELNKRYDGWAYRVAEFKAKNFRRRMAELIEKVEKKGEDGAS